MTGPWMITTTLLAVLVIAQATVVVGVLLRIAHRLDRAATVRQDGPPHPAPGTRLPQLDLTDSNGRPLPSDTHSRLPMVLLLVSADCPPCRRLLDLISTSGDVPAVSVLVVADERKPLEVSLPLWARLAYQRDASLTRALGADRTPLAIAVAADATVTATRVPTSPADLTQLASSLTPNAESPGAAHPTPHTNGGTAIVPAAPQPLAGP
ncbi:TlpA family protein disulfide reductase [Nocardia nepalensis]|uniref:TlpA family protein disulfide reductase n=1 Tax=Nocardia nepalensis TaxID=3375448 RepID=UPI003B671B08